MKVINKKMCVVILLVIVEISSLFLMYKSNNNKEIKLDSVETKIEDNSLFALMVEQTIGTYTTSSSTTWPTGYVLNTLKSGCIDNKGHKIENGMQYDESNNKVIIDTDKTSNCYVYLSKSTYDRVLASTQVWKTNRLSNDGYRYFGSGNTTNADAGPANYVCFGTQSKSECVSDTDKYMYRIIGMFQEETTSGGYNIVNTSSEYHLKLIKKEALNTKYAWTADNQIETNWSASDLYKGLNDSYFLYNMNYHYMQENFWYSKITKWKWNAANTSLNNSDYMYQYMTMNNIYLDEMNRSGKTSSTSLYDTPIAKIGLMYVSDYIMSGGTDYLSYQGGTDMRASWIYLGNNDGVTLSTTGIAPPHSYEWTISRIGYSSDYYRAYAFTFGKISTAAGTVTNAISVRPVFYLNSDVVICAGTGTSTDPYILG